MLTSQTLLCVTAPGFSRENITSCTSVSWLVRCSLSFHGFCTSDIRNLGLTGLVNQTLKPTVLVMTLSTQISIPIIAHAAGLPPVKRYLHTSWIPHSNCSYSKSPLISSSQVLQLRIFLKYILGAIGASSLTTDFYCGSIHSGTHSFVSLIYRGAFFQKYNYVLSAALDAG